MNATAAIRSVEDKANRTSAVLRNAKNRSGIPTKPPSVGTVKSQVINARLALSTAAMVYDALQYTDLPSAADYGPELLEELAAIKDRIANLEQLAALAQYKPRD